MLVDTPQITWHGGEAGKNAPVLSLDVHPLPLPVDYGGKESRNDASRFVLATAGTDAEVRLWVVSQPFESDQEVGEEAEVSRQLQSFVTSLGGHQRGVNVVRFSPDGLSLASASDGGTVVIWSVSDMGSWHKLTSDRDTKKTILRGATEDIYDLTWSPDGKYIACGSIDRRTHVWEVATKGSIATLEDHTNYVQGTAWDPLSRYLATQSSDRSCRVYQIARGGQDGVDGPFCVPERLAIKCCNLIKSCVVTEHQNCEESRNIAPLGDREGGRHPPANSTQADRSFSEGLGTSVPALPNPSTAKPEAPSSRVDVGSNAANTAPPAALGRGENGSIFNSANETWSDPTRGKEDVPFEKAWGKYEDGNGQPFTTMADVTKDKPKPAQRRNLFVDETVTSFFRRLSWTPDGAFLIAPTAQSWNPAARKSQFCTYLFTRGQFVKPAVCLPGLHKPSVAVRCNPRLFALKGERGCIDATNEAPVSDLPYRVVFAVVSLDAVVVYDTEHSHPLAVASGLHYSGLTDACWSADGLSLFVSSTDGYVSTFHFQPGELGTTIPNESVPLQTQRLHPIIYGWRTEATTKDCLGKVLSPRSCSANAATRRSPSEVSTPGNLTMSDIHKTEAPAASSCEVGSSKPKKKIAPTLLTKLPASALRHEIPPEMSSIRPMYPGERSTSPTTADVLRGDRRKRRIAPTLVRHNVEEADASGCDAGLGSADRTDQGGKSISFIGSASAPTPSCTAKSTTGTGHGNATPKKKRLAPTLVSAL